MFCINCFHIKTQVVNSRPHKKHPTIWRRRHCIKCDATFSTLERVALTDQRQVHAADGAVQLFNIGQLIISISKAFTHNEQAAKQDALWLAQTVETSLTSQTRGLITTDQIAHITYDVIKKYDELAAVQYAAKHRLISSLRKRGRPSLASPEQLS